MLALQIFTFNLEKNGCFLLKYCNACFELAFVKIVFKEENGLHSVISILRVVSHLS